MTDDRQHARHWRDYRTASGGRPVKWFLISLTKEERGAVLDAMSEVRVEGLRAARHLRGDVYEVRAATPDRTFRVLFAAEGRFGQVLLALDAFAKTTRKTPPQKIRLAEQRLRDWRGRR